MEAGEDTSEQYNHGKPQKLRHRRGEGAIADFACFHAPSSPPQRRPLCNNNDLLDFL